MSKQYKFYWDSCVWLGLVNQEYNKYPTAKFVINQAERGRAKIFISSLTYAEVYKRYCEGRLRSLAEEKDIILEDFFTNHYINFVQIGRDIGIKARMYLRYFDSLRKPYDAVHLALACYTNVDELHTFDGSDLLPLDGKVEKRDGSLLTICKPMLALPMATPLESLQLRQSDQHTLFDSEPIVINKGLGNGS